MTAPAYPGPPVKPFGDERDIHTLQVAAGIPPTVTAQSFAEDVASVRAQLARLKATNAVGPRPERFDYRPARRVIEAICGQRDYAAEAAEFSDNRRHFNEFLNHRAEMAVTR